MTQPKVTTAGALVLKHSMPTEAAKQSFNAYKPLDKSGMSEMVAMLLKHGGEKAPEHINSLGKMFFNKATEIGATTPLSDYINDSEERQALIKEYDFKVQELLSKKLPAPQQNAELANLTGAYNKKMETQNLEYLLSKKSTAAKMARTGARGNPSQLATGTASPLMSLNAKGELVPLVIKHSFAEGMTPAEHLAMSYMGRGSTVLSQLSTALPGALFKRLAPTVFHEVITVEDCRTHNGIMAKVDDTKKVFGRYLADTNQLVTERALKDLKMSGVKQIKIRSSLTCEAPEGVCKHCYGLAPNGSLPSIGENVGVVAAQSVSEVLTQAMLSTKHKATVGERKGNAYEQASNLLNNPADNFKDEASISQINGRVSKISKTPLGDHMVFVNEQGHFVPQNQNLTVQEGDKIEQGQPLSTGVINPRKLVSLRGLGAGRDYMAKELRGIYGGGLDPRHFEIISRNLMKYVEVEDPGETGLLPGEKVTVNRIQKYLTNTSGKVSLDKAEGKLLAKGALHLVPGTLLDPNHLQELKDHGINEVEVSSANLKIKPIVPGLQTSKLLDPNWISRLSFSRLKDTIKDSAALGSESDLHSTDPISPYMMGNEFGEGINGRY